MRFASLGSGSRGNATLLEADGTRLLLDCGFSVKELEQRLDPLGVDCGSIDAVLVTHEHQDHIRGIGALARRYGMPVWMTHGTHQAGRCGKIPRLNLFHAHETQIEVGAIRVQPFPVPHDAREPVQMVFRCADLQVGVLTDLGMITPHVTSMMTGCDALLLECNHDPGMLASGPYPPALQRRVGGSYGHLSNHQAAALLSGLDHGRLRHLVAAHLSEKNNTPVLARDTLLEAVPSLDDRLSVLVQDQASGWFEL